MENKKGEDFNNTEKKRKQIKILSIIAIVVLIIVISIILLKEINYIMSDSDTDVSFKTSDEKTSSNHTNQQGDKDNQVSSDNLVFEHSQSSNVSQKTSNSVGNVSIKFLYKDNYWDKYDLTNAVYKTSKEYEEAVCNYMNQIVSYLGKEDWFQQYEGKDILYIELDVRGDDYYEKLKQQQDRQEFDDVMPIFGTHMSFEDYGPKSLKCTLNFNSSMFERNSIPLVYALTNLITYHKDKNRSSFSDSLSVGLNESVQAYLDMGTASCNRGLDIHNYVIELKKMIVKNTQIRFYLKNREDYYRMGSETFNFGYINILNLDYYWIASSHSFVEYLIQTYGIENVIKMMDGYDESIYYLFNDKGLDGLLADWEQFLDNYPCKMTWDEINTYITDFKSAHGY